MKYLLDSNFLISIFRGEKSALNKAKRLQNEDHDVFTTSINAAELYEGAFRSTRTSSHLQILEGLWELFPVIEFSKHHAKEFGRIKAQLNLDEYNVNDILIASVANYLQAVVITKNKKGFEKTGAALEGW
ncbi:MAG: type II toxin-antitoxin system VapC family toxin [Candidatus Heimdallarchaeota archaeon]|nr:type II toxin-antitoxin system VapC family toxin [Candidatus Heimdallarchaeota archaeon]